MSIESLRAKWKGIKFAHVKHTKSVEKPTIPDYILEVFEGEGVFDQKNWEDIPEERPTCHPCDPPEISVGDPADCYYGAECTFRGRKGKPGVKGLYCFYEALAKGKSGRQKLCSVMIVKCPAKEEK